MKEAPVLPPRSPSDPDSQPLQGGAGGAPLAARWTRRVTPWMEASISHPTAWVISSPTNGVAVVTKARLCAVVGTVPSAYFLPLAPGFP